MLGSIELLRGRDIPVRCIVPENDPIIDEGNAGADYLRSIGVELVQYQPGMFKECAVLMNFGEDHAFELMRKYGDRPRYSVWSSCMHFVCDIDIEVFKEGLVDEFFFQTDLHGEGTGKQIARQARKAVPYRKGYMAYFPMESRFINVGDSRPADKFRVCKIGRDDPAKYHIDTWKMFAAINGPVDVQIEIMGWGPNAEQKIGNPCVRGHRYFRELNLELHGHEHNPEAVGQFWTHASSNGMPRPRADLRPVNPLVWIAMGVVALAGLGFLVMGQGNSSYIPAALCLVAAAVLGVGGLIYRRGGEKKGPPMNGPRYGRGPYAAAVCSPSPEFVRHLAETLRELREAAAQADLTLDGERLNEILGRAAAGKQSGDHAQAVRNYCQGIGFVVAEFKRQGKSRPGSGRR